ncbi:hypothetical protein [Pedobacter mucosus]|uniref:hypothetical protein n=1 Tax=Pedobacter mucosus TaxID=2895286 RepID=UPI001EE40565|nr:hypothetical protein [Pedobacter mucosus]UKT62898.1 hypothetical protein LOK61_14125 [Pedobacter mucosus]
MDWNKLISQFLNGDTDAIQAVFTVAGFFVGIVGTFFVARSFSQQTKINLQQYELNRIAGEKHRRVIRPNFQIEPINEGLTLIGFRLKLTNAIALNIRLYSCDAMGNKTSELLSSHNAWEPGEQSKIYPINKEAVLNDVNKFAELCYDDEDGTKYFQELKRRANEIYVTFPILS